MRRWTVLLTLGACVLVAVVFAGLRFNGDLNALIHRPVAIDSSFKPKPEASMIFAGSQSRRIDPFYLAGGTYRFLWSAWGPAAEYPPCSHSVELLAVDPANAAASDGHVADLAKRVDVPGGGSSDERYIANLKPGEYYLDIHSDCGWQISISRAG